MYGKVGELGLSLCALEILYFRLCEIVSGEFSH